MSTEPRSVKVVAEQILSIIPEANIESRKEISNFIQGLWNQAPETFYGSYNWGRFIQVLNNAIGTNTNSELRKQIHNILSGTEQ